MSIGSLSVLNVGAGDIKVVFNKDDKGESKRAIRMLSDMQQRGYLIAVELPDGSYTRAERIDATRGRYVITVPDDVADPAEAEPVAATRKGSTKKSVVKGKRGRKVSVPIQKARAVGVARSAGG